MQKEVMEFWDQEDFEAQKALIAGTVPWESSEALAATHRQYIETPVIRNTLENMVRPVVVEIGCGVGRLVKEFRKSPNYAIIGVDISPKMIAKAREYLKSCDIGIALYVTDGERLPIADWSADFVYSFLVFQHIQTKAEVDKYVDEVVRILKPGGFFRVQTLKGQPVPDGKFGGWHGQFYRSLELFKDAFKRDSLEVVEAEENLGCHGWLWVTVRKKL